VRNFLRFGFIVALVCGAGVVGSANPVEAHAGLKSSEPAASSVLEQSPDEIVLKFAEQVEISFGSIRLFDANSKLITLSTPNYGLTDGVVDAKTVRVGVPTLEPGSYLVVWRVVSVDSHPVQGAFGFQIGARGKNLAALGVEVLSNSSASNFVKVVMGFARWLSFLGVMVLIGSMLLATRIIGQSRIENVIKASWFVAVVGSAIVLVMQAPYALGSSLSDSVSVTSVRQVLETRLGAWLTIRAVILFLFLVIIWKRDLHQKPIWRMATTILSVVLFATFSIPGHPGMRQFSSLSIGTDIVHFLSVAVWMGGLVTIVLLGRKWQSESPKVIAWFSFNATIAMPIMVATGVAQAWRMMEGFQNLFSTTYGTVLSIKVLVVVVAIATGTKARQIFKDKKVDSEDLKKIKFSKTIVVESVIGLVVLAVTAVLVSVPPLSVNTATPFTATLVQSNVIADITITPARVGNAEMHIVFSPPGGTLEPIESMTARISLVSGEIPPIPIGMKAIGVNHFQANLQVPRDGEWLLELIVKPATNRTLRFSQIVKIKN
jgi:copper transport protein